MLSLEKYLTVPGDMKSVHELTLKEETRLICTEYPTYLFFVVNVPKVLDFVDKHPADMFF
jgi:hypothetical protein